MTPRELPATWRRDAETLERYNQPGAALLRRVADELDAALRSEGDDVLDLAAAAKESGYSPDRLRHKIASGELANAGRKGAPLIRRADLPVKRRRTGSAFDAAATARSIVRPDQDGAA